MGSVQPSFLGRGSRGPPEVIGRGASLGHGVWVNLRNTTTTTISTTTTSIYSNSILTTTYIFDFFISPVSIFLFFLSLRVAAIYFGRETITTLFRYQYLYHFYHYYSIEDPSGKTIHNLT